MDKVFISTKMEVVMMVYGKIAKEKVKVLWYTQMAMFMKELGLMT